MCQKAKEIDYGVDSDYNAEKAFTLAKIQEIQEKRDINTDYPNCEEISSENFNSLIIKNL